VKLLVRAATRRRIENALRARRHVWLRVALVTVDDKGDEHTKGADVRLVR
jgi:hypothetical protein